MKYEKIHMCSSMFDVKKMCDVLGVKRENYYRWVSSQKRKEERQKEENESIRLVEEAFEESGRVNGYRRIARDLNEAGHAISEYKVRRIMRENGFYPELAVKYKPQRNGKTDGRYCENIVRQQFDVKRKNQVWAGDITYIKTSIGWVYLAVVMDLFNREIIGYDIGKRIDTQLVKNALGNAIGKRGTNDGLIFHSDRGCQYASNGYQNMLKDKEITGSMSRPGCPYDNSCVESFFASLKKEKIYRRSYATMEEVKDDVFWYIEIFYNRKRRHSTLGYLTPIEYLLKYDDEGVA